VEVWGLQLPGRGPRYAEPHHTELSGLVAAVVAGSQFHGPFAFFGHSLGALVAFEVTRALREGGRELPVHLLASAYPAPHQPRNRRPLHLLADEELLAAVAGQYGDTFGAVRDDPELLRDSVAAYRADFSIFETYRHISGPPLEIPITAFGGRADDGEISELEAWRQHTSVGFDLRIFPGGHFYLRDHRDELLGSIAEALRHEAADAQTPHAKLQSVKPEPLKRVPPMNTPVTRLS
jgi:surfactin synthase thioesterase subunit